jgi:hypothetical protein
MSYRGSVVHVPTWIDGEDIAGHSGNGHSKGREGEQDRNRRESEHWEVVDVNGLA